VNQVAMSSKYKCLPYILFKNNIWNCKCYIQKFNLKILIFYSQSMYTVVHTIIHAGFQLSDKIPCISAIVAGQSSLSYNSFWILITSKIHNLLRHWQIFLSLTHLFCFMTLYNLYSFRFVVSTAGCRQLSPA